MPKGVATGVEGTVRVSERVDAVRDDRDAAQCMLGVQANSLQPRLTEE